MEPRGQSNYMITMTYATPTELINSPLRAIYLNQSTVRNKNKRLKSSPVARPTSYQDTNALFLPFFTAANRQVPNRSNLI